jgi:hypothetical protein
MTLLSTFSAIRLRSGIALDGTKYKDWQTCCPERRDCFLTFPSAIGASHGHDESENGLSSHHLRSVRDPIAGLLMPFMPSDAIRGLACC